MRRPRGPGGRFLTADEIAAQRLAVSDDPASSSALDHDNDHDDEIHDEDVIEPDIIQARDQPVQPIRPRDPPAPGHLHRDHNRHPCPSSSLDHLIDTPSRSHSPPSQSALPPVGSLCNRITSSLPSPTTPPSNPLVRDHASEPITPVLHSPYHPQIHHIPPPHAHAHPRHIYPPNPAPVHVSDSSVHRRTGNIVPFHAQRNPISPSS